VQPFPFVEWRRGNPRGHKGRLKKNAWAVAKQGGRPVNLVRTNRKKKIEKIFSGETISILPGKLAYLEGGGGGREGSDQKIRAAKIASAEVRKGSKSRRGPMSNSWTKKSRRGESRKERRIKGDFRVGNV